MPPEVTVDHFQNSESGLNKLLKPSIINALPHYLPLGIFPLLFLAATYGGWWLLPAFIFMSVTDLFDKWLGVDGKNLDPHTTTEKRLFWHNLPVWTWGCLWPIILIYSMWQILVVQQLSIWESVALVIILAIEAQAVFVIGHELIHRRVPWERRLAEFLLASASYPTYATEHVYIHHAKVGTPYDLGSVQKGVSFWHYLPKEVFSNITNSWALDKDRLARRGLPVWHYSNPFWRYGLELLFWYGIAFYMGGIWAIPIFAFLGFGCVFSMKISNYLQHYALRRIMLPNGRWEKVAPRHSWSADWKFSNWMFFNMQRHADHHATASRHYPLLQVRGPDESPQLPGTYADMMNIVIRPKKWFEKMDPLVEQWRQHFYPDMDDWSAYDSPLAISRPDDFAFILEIFGASPRLAKRIESHPKLLDSLKSREFIDLDLPKGFDANPEFDSMLRQGLARVYWTYELDVREMKDRIGEWPAADAKETALIVQGWSNDKAFQIGMHVVRGNLTPIEASVAFSNLAEASVSTVLEAVVADFEERMGPLPISIAATFPDDFATREVQLGSEPNLVFVHDSKENEISIKIGNRLKEVLTILASDSLLFAPISGNSNALRSIAISELDVYCKKDADQAISILTKSRCVFQSGTSDMEKLYQVERDKLIASKSIVEPLQKHLQHFEYDEDGQSVTSIMKKALNGIDRSVSFLELKKLEEGPLGKPLSAGTILNNAGYETLAKAYLSWKELHGILSLVGDDEIEEYPSSVQLLVAKICNYDDFEALETMVDEQGQATTLQLNSILQT
ncbi:MAG: fatty acid desaturase [Rhodobacteraceae bacterium]|nr:fatty acid desaturase [Paracoccaceae bacterium]